MNCYKFLSSVLFLIFTILNDEAQPLAFPGAEGFGKYTTGGRGGRVIYVTNLNDSGEGSLRAAIDAKGPRTILFKVSGNIFLSSTLGVKHGDITLAGQTAPGDGICICNYPFKIAADNVIVRFVRFRLGDRMKVQEDALGGAKHSNIIIDHCSASWSVDETASFYDNRNFTMQWCIISESLYNSVHKKGEHGYGGIWGGQGASFHHNLLSDHTNRNPRFCGSRYTKNPAAELVDMRNNVIYNWGYNSTYGGEGGNQNIVNNYYKPGPATIRSARSRILDLTSYYYDPSVRPDTLYTGKFYVAGNYVEGAPEATKDNWTYGVREEINGAKNKAKLDKPLADNGVITHSAQKAYSLVLKYAGAILPKRDNVDNRIIAEVQSGKETYGGAYDTRVGRVSGIINSQSTVGGWPNLRQAAAPTDTDNDGIPDTWEVNNKLNPNAPSDASAFTISNIYTNLEVYLNSLAPGE